MKRLLILFALFAWAGITKISADNNEDIKDSLLKVLSAQPMGKERFNTLYTLACLDQMSPSCIYYLDKLLKESSAHNDAEFQCLAMYGHVIYYFNHQNESNMSMWMDRLSDAALKHKCYNSYFQGKRAEVTMYIIKKKIEYSITQAEEMFELAGKLNNVQGMISAKLCLMNAYLSTARTYEGESAGFEAYRLLPPDASLEDRKVVLQEITLACSSTKNKDFLKYLEEFRRVLDKLSKRKYDLTVNEGNYLLVETLYADYYLNADSLEEARRHLAEMDKYLSPASFIPYKGLYHEAYSHYYQLIKEYDKALLHSEKAVELLSSLSSDGGLNLKIERAGLLAEAGQIEVAIPLFQNLLAQKDSFYRNLSISQMDEIYRMRNMDDLLLAKERQRSIFHYISFTLIAIALSIMIPSTIRIYRMRKRLREEEKEILRLNSVTEEANEVKSRFLADMSHDIRVPLNNVLGFSQIITTEHESISEPQWKEYSEIIQTNSAELIQMVNDVLDLSRLEAGRTKWQIQEYDLILLCPDVVGMAKMQGGEKLNIEYHTEIESQPLQMDIFRFTQLLISTLSYSGPENKARTISFTLVRDEPTQLLVFRIANSPLADPKLKSQKTEIRNTINRLTIEYFKGTYTVDSDTAGETTVVFTYPYSL